MFLSNPVKIFHAAWLLSIVFAGCSLWRSEQSAANTPPPPRASEYPFSLHEPEIFQTELVIRTGENERHIFIARSGDKRRIDYDVGTDHQRTVLITDKEYLLTFKRKEYSERPLTSDLASFDATLTGQMVNARDYSDFEEVGRDGSTIQYKAHVNEGTASEVMIYFDRSFGLPMKQEFYSIEGETRTLQYSVELRGLKTEVDPSVFEIGKDFRKVNNERRQ
ncbi:MAG: hypothetical protein DMF63_16950 [Acidobacteria bacterium]|nr:MAG: hypothetical protein DMF63_16950 [Acidobacteriota bacterium]